ncbi:MAG: class I SAM-dependent rRNA methyltransferase [Firmicutes bacterium]|nr:class I SAM-dependent rRNA methyltransferase [Bacillota bacterium]
MSKCKVYLLPGEETRILEGHSWVYNNEVLRLEGDIVSGDIVDVYSSLNKFIGKGFLNTQSKIFVRIVSRKDVEIDYDFFNQIIVKANQYKTELGFQNSYRVLFAEADGMPGLIVDKYGEYLSIQILSLGIDKRKQIFIDILVSLFHPKGIYERSDVPIRTKEGLDLFKGTIYGDVPDEVLIEENGIFLSVDLKSGQKTGTFLDQQANHFALQSYVNQKDVLDCFSHIGSFALHAKKANAKNVTAVDISEVACNRIKKNAKLNELEIKVVQANVFHLLRDYQAENKKFDVIILDPPAFAKTTSKIASAYKGYKDINLQAMKLISNGGYLITASCSHFMTPALFLQMLKEAENDAQKTCQMIDFRIQGKDHPTLLGSEETLYLKLVVLRVLDK